LTDRQTAEALVDLLDVPDDEEGPDGVPDDEDPEDGSAADLG
jgi:hypothetical protein